MRRFSSRRVVFLAVMVGLLLALALPMAVLARSGAAVVTQTLYLRRSAGGSAILATVPVGEIVQVGGDVTVEICDPPASENCWEEIWVYVTWAAPWSREYGGVGGWITFFESIHCLDSVPPPEMPDYDPSRYPPEVPSRDPYRYSPWWW